MTTMKSVQTAEPGKIEVAETEHPVPGPRDLLVRIRACGICGTDATFVQMGGMPLGPDGQTAAIPLGHEPAGEVVEVAVEVADLQAGDRVVVNPPAAPSGILAGGGALGGMSEYLLIENAVAGKSVALFPGSLPFEVAALNEPMAVARHCVNRSDPRPSDKVVVFGAGAYWTRGGDVAEAAWGEAGHSPACPGALAEVIGQPRTTRQESIHAPGGRTELISRAAFQPPAAPPSCHRTNLRPPRTRRAHNALQTPRATPISGKTGSPKRPEIPGQFMTYLLAGSCHA